MRITLPSGAPAELARAQGAALGLVIAPDIGGLRPLFDDMCARLCADEGLTACAVEPFPGREEITLEERLNGGVASLDDARQLADLVAAADATECDTVAVAGFCMGGMYAMKAAGTGRFSRAVSFYGMVHVPEQFAGPGQGQPLDYLARPGACPVLAIVGGKDPWIAPEHVPELEAAGVTVAYYPDAEHGFVHDPDRPAHRPDDAADAWRRALEFIRA